MEVSRPRFQKYLFVCENTRADGSACCGAAGASLYLKLKEAAKAAGFAGRVRVSRTGCLDACADGPNVLLMPDNTWFKKVSESDIDSILKRIK